MTDRFVVLTPTGAPVIRTNDPATAHYWAGVINGTITETT